MSGQLALFDVAENGNGNSRRLTKGETGLRDVPPGAERLLAELVRRDLPNGDLRAAAALCLALDEGTNGR